MLRLAPSAQHLAVVAERIRLLELASRDSPGDIAGDECEVFDDGVWAVDAADGTPVVRRYTLDLREAAAAVLPPGAELIRGSYGAPCAVWHAARPVRIVGDREGLVVESLEGFADGDRAVPMTMQRTIRIRGREIALVDPAGPRWTFDAGGGRRAVAAAPLLDGRLIAATISGHAEGAQQLVVLDVRDGRVQHRLGLRAVTAARFTALRELAVLRAEHSQLIVVDLRFGKVLRHDDTDRAIVDLAIDDAGQRLVVLYEDGELADLAVTDLLAGRVITTSAAGAPPPPLEPEPEAPAPAAAPEPTPDAAPEPLVVPPLVALRPRAPDRACAPEVLDRWLDHRRAWVAATAAHAIARGWDSGEIAFVDEARPPFEKEVAAQVLGLRGLATLQLRKTVETLASACAALAAFEATLDDRDTPLAAVARELGLDALDQQLLVLVAAPALWGELARLYGILANDERRAACDEQLLVQLCGTDERRRIARALGRDRPLVRHGLIQVALDRPPPFAALAVDPLVLRILRGEPLETELDPGVELAPPPPLDDLLVPHAPVQAAIDALAGERTDVRLIVRGRAGTGRRSLVAALAARAGRRVGTVDAASHVRERRLDRLATVLRRTALRGWIPLVDGLEVVPDDLRAAVAAVLRDHPGPLAIRLAHDARLRIPDAIELALPPPSLGALADHWRARLATLDRRADDADALAARFRVGPGTIERCLATLPAGAAIEDAMRHQLASSLGEVATRIERLPTWSQVVLPDDIQDSVLELIARIRCARTVYDRWGFDQIVTTSRGVTALFQGPPGTGKTLVAGAIANELGLDLYRVDVSRVMSKWIGETEQNLAKVFAAAEDSQAILLFDEADSLFARRTEVKSSNDRYANTEVNYLLQRLDSFEGIAILTTNFGSSIDAAFKRRLSFRLTFPFPDDDTREQLWKAHLPPRLPRAGTIDLAALARRFRMSGGYIRNAALRAAFLAAEERTALTQDHLERAIRAEYREIGNIADSGVLA